MEKQRIFSEEHPFFSVVMPVHNQANIIRKNVQSILEMTTCRPYELILVIDACSDKTETILQDWLSEIREEQYPFLTTVTLLVSSKPLFETAADNAGFRKARGKYLLEIQADMTMVEYGYNMRLLRPFELDSTMIGVSGRCCHTFDGSHGIGKLGDLITQPLSALPHIDRTCYYVSQTCNRGPLMLDHSKTRDIGYLDEIHYFLDNSDHDLFMRSNLSHGYRCAYVPIDFDSPMEDGSTRKPRDAVNQAAYNYKKLQMAKNGPTFIDRNIYRFPNNPVTPFEKLNLEVIE